MWTRRWVIDRHTALRSFPMQNKQLIWAAGTEQSTDKLFSMAAMFNLFYLCSAHWTDDMLHAPAWGSEVAVKSNQRVALSWLCCAVCVHHTTCTLERNTLMWRRMSESWVFSSASVAGGTRKWIQQQHGDAPEREYRNYPSKGEHRFDSILFFSTSAKSKIPISIEIRLIAQH